MSERTRSFHIDKALDGVSMRWLKNCGCAPLKERTHVSLKTSFAAVAILLLAACPIDHSGYDSAHPVYDGGVFEDADTTPDANTTPDAGTSCQEECSQAGELICVDGELRSCYVNGDSCLVWGEAHSCSSGLCADDRHCESAEYLQISAGGSHSCGLKSDGSVLC